MDTYFQRVMQWLTVGLGSLSLMLIAYAFIGYEGGDFEARLVPAHLRGETPWVSVFEDDIAEGTTIPAHSNVIIHIPADVEVITRKTLLGRRGTEVRYWGYCFPKNYEEALALKRRGFPGRLFLSEKEREIRLEEERKRRSGRYSIYRNVNLDDLLNETTTNRGIIRHQKEVFYGGETCYVMAEMPLPVGIDLDEDGVNSVLEREWNSHPQKKDTDADGVDDGIEIFELGTFAHVRDSDGDGIIDGLEDANRNGILEAEDTDPLNRDSDRDGLCDGLCRIGINGKEIRGEDVNLNGIVDEGELDPRKMDSDDDGIFDEQEYFNCVLEGQTGTCKYGSYPVQ